MQKHGQTVGKRNPPAGAGSGESGLFVNGVVNADGVRKEVRINRGGGIGEKTQTGTLNCNIGVFQKIGDCRRIVDRAEFDLRSVGGADLLRQILRFRESPVDQKQSSDFPGGKIGRGGISVIEAFSGSKEKASRRACARPYPSVVSP